MLAKGRVLALAAGVTVMVVAWGVLVFAAIDRGRAPNDSAQDWLVLVGATIGAVACMFIAILSAARLRDLLRGGQADRDDAEWTEEVAAPIEERELTVEEATGQRGWIPSQRTADSTQYVAANGRGRAYAEDEDETSFLSYAGQGETYRDDAETAAHEPQWANETGEQYYRELGQRTTSRHSASGADSRTRHDSSVTKEPDDPPSSVAYATPGKRALR